MSNDHVVFGAYINEWSLAQGLKRIGIVLRKLGTPGAFLKNTIASIHDVPTLYFSDDTNFVAWHDRSDVVFEPRLDAEMHVWDKVWFARYLSDLGEAPIPWQCLGEAAPWLPVVVKPRSSIDRKMCSINRGVVCRDEMEFRACRERIGIHRDKVFVQRLLEGGCRNNFSVCGYYDCERSNRNLIVVMRKMFADRDALGTGVIMETFDDPANLVVRTSRILQALRYIGPFELEFFLDDKSGIFYVVELNPRFWMQHHVFIAGYGNGLIRRYLHLDEGGIENNGECATKTIVWGDTIAIIRAALRCNVMPLVHVFLSTLRKDTQMCLCPNWRAAVSFIFGTRVFRSNR